MEVPHPYTDTTETCLRAADSRIVFRVATDIWTFSQYSDVAGSSRVRIYDWLKFLDLKATNKCFFQEPPRSLMSLLTLPPLLYTRTREMKRFSTLNIPKLFISKSVSPFSSGRLEKDLLESSAHGVYDFDDAVMFPESQGLLRKAFDPMKKFTLMVKAASRVIAGNHWLAEIASQFTKEVIVIPSCVSTALIPMKVEYTLGAVPRMVWIGSSTTEKYLESILPALAIVHKITGARTSVISSPRIGDLDRSPFVDRLPWTMLSQGQLSEFDIGLSPLFDGRWERGKCGYKALQYGAAGLPVVGSPIGVNQEILEKYGSPQATTIDEWVDTLIDLIRSPASERADLGAREREIVETEYSFKAWRQIWEKTVLD